MSKQSHMAFRVEQELGASFTLAAELEQRPADQVLRELMKLYVVQVGERHTADLAKPLVSAAEQSRRAKAIAFARGSVALEGFTTTPEVEALTQRFIKGELSHEDAMKALNGRIGRE